MTDAKTPAPAFSVVAGNPTEEELAAVLVVLQARAAAVEPRPRPAGSVGWAAPAARLRRPLSPGPGAWQASAWR